jgi:hypothetical protein
MNIRIQYKKEDKNTIFRDAFDSPFPDSFALGHKDKKKKKAEPEIGGPGQPISINSVKKAFEVVPDESAEYQFILYVDQPKKGKKRKFKLKGFDVGHTFIKLTKIGADCGAIEQIFGFYPSKEQGGLSGSPFKPKVKSIFKNNEKHPYDELIKKYPVTKEQFDKVLDVATAFELSKYCLAGHNCTDFGMAAAEAAGIKLPHTVTKIPLTGRGVNPADLGQDIIKGKVEKQEGVTIDINSGIATKQAAY